MSAIKPCPRKSRGSTLGLMIQPGEGTHMRHRILMALIASLVLLGALLGVVACTPVTGDPAALIEEGRTKLDSGDLDGAIQSLEQATQRDANSAEAHFLLGNAYAKKEQFSQAEQQLRKALEIDDSYTDARSNLGVALYRQGKLQEAEKVFRTALASQPNDAEIHYNLGGVLVALNKLDEALSEFHNAKALDPDLAESYLGMGSIYKLQGKSEQAISMLREYLRLSDDPTWREHARQMIIELGGKP